jgi:hypothetical protein
MFAPRSRKILGCIVEVVGRIVVDEVDATVAKAAVEVELL